MHTQDAIDRFHKKTNKTDTCWLWTGSVNCRNGRSLSYGRWRVYPRPHPHVYVHRFSYEAFVGPIPTGIMVCHTCDVPLCVNPAHLFLGTAKDNAQDAIKKGRFKFENTLLKGEDNILCKLTNEKVRTIRECHGKLSSREVGRRFGVNESTIRSIWNGKTWKHV